MTAGERQREPDAAEDRWAFITVISGVRDELERARLSASLVSSILRCRACGIALIDREDDSWRLAVQVDGKLLGTHESALAMDALKSPLEKAFRRPSVHMVETRVGKRGDAVSIGLPGWPAGGLVVMPLVTRHEQIGILFVAVDEGVELGRDDQVFLSRLGQQLAIGIANLRLERRLAKRTRELETARDELEAKVAERTAELRESRDHLITVTNAQGALLSINKEISAHLTRKELFPGVAAALRTLVGFDRLGIFIPRDGNQDLRVYTLLAGAAGPIIRRDATFPIEGTVPGWVMEKREPFAGSCLDDYRDHPESHNVLAQEGIESICAVPLIGSETCIGVLVLYAKAPDNFRPEDVELVSNVADAIAIGLDRCLVHERVEQLKQRLELENVYLQEEISLHQNFENIIGRSTSIMETLEAVETVAPTHANVLITGETGTGKELVARAVHDLSERSDRPLIKVNCATIPKDLFESEFFGHVKGAFTGALKTRAGRFELADKGTLFLDEVGEIPIEMQSKLLRVLQEGEFERVGEERTRRVDVRIIAATNRDLNEEVVNGRFRQDLYYRLNVFPIHVAPLRERPADLPLLAAHFLERAAAEMGRNTPTFSEHDMAMLRSYDWPGNVRELQNVIERAVISSRGGKLRVDLPSGEQQREATTGEEIGGAQAPSDTAHTAEDVSLAAIEKQHILRVLDINEGNKAKTARELGIDPKTLYKRLREYGLLPPRE